MKTHAIVSGIRATGRLHIGNYLGALKQFVDLQNQGDNHCYFFIADLHALTTPFEPKELSQNTLEVVAEYLAAGIDPKKSTFFLQNQILEHAELAWIFNSITPLGELERMTQYKDKSEQHRTNINAGLLTYPTLMAADILIYKPIFVPVGDDQMQHLELTRVIARKFNNRFGKTFPEPKNITIKPLRIMSLTDPTRKMSKSEPNGCLFLDDSPDDINKKIKKAVTATDSKNGSAGVDNLLSMLAHFGNEDQAESFRKAAKDGNIKYSELKTVLADVVSEHFGAFRDRKKELLADKNHLAQILADGAKRAKTVASETLIEVKQKIGLI